LSKIDRGWNAEIDTVARKILNRLRKDEGGGELEFKFYTPAKGHPDWDDISESAADLVDSVSETVEFDRGTPGEIAAEARRITDALTTTGRSMITNYRRLKNGNENLIPPYFIWTMSNACNFRCSYCDNHRGQKYFDLPSRETLSTEKGKKLLEICRKNVTGIYFCGGEPTLRKNLPELTAHAHSINYFPLMINTNGSRIHRILADPAYSKWLKQMDIIIVSLDALDVGLLAKTWGMKKDLCRQVMVNILALRRLQEKVRFKLMVNTVITPGTIGEADKILDWANDLGIWYSPVPMNYGPTAKQELLDDPEYRSLARKIVKRKKEGYKVLGSKKLVESLLNEKPIDCYPTLKPHVDPDGSLLWPCKGVASFEPARINVLDHGSFDEALQAAARVVDPTGIHGHGPGQCGADCKWMQNYVSDAYARGLRKPVSSGVLLEIAEFVGVV